MGECAAAKGLAEESGAFKELGAWAEHVKGIAEVVFLVRWGVGVEGG